MIRVRFAPSPTGFLHIGGVRTALFNFLYARNQKGQFLLRLEDTDRERSKKEFEEDILEAMRWLGLGWDEDIVRQSLRLEEYQRIARELVQKDLAYEETQNGRAAVKFRIPKKKALFHDLVRGPVEFDASLFDDLVIIKSDGYPTYHLACVVDDNSMNITHVIRGDDHLSNTPRQLLLFEALGWKPPKYAHLPLILGADGTPLSKRHGAVAIRSYRQEGFLPEAVLNYLALLGWGPEANEEFFRLEDLVRKFSIKRITKSGARFNREKLEWLNAEHIKKMPEAAYLEAMTAYFKKESAQFPPDTWKKLLLLYRTRIKTFRDLLEEASYCFSDVENCDEKTAAGFFEKAQLREHLHSWIEKASGLRDFDDPKSTEEMTRELAGERRVEARDLIHPLRFALTGKTVSPGLFELMGVLGKDTCLARIRRFITLGDRRSKM